MQDNKVNAIDLRKANIEESIKLAFEFYDKNKSGYLEKSEVRSFLKDIFADDCTEDFELNENFLEAFIECLNPDDTKVSLKDLIKSLSPLINNYNSDI